MVEQIFEKYFPKQKYIYTITALGGKKSKPILTKILPFMTIDYKIDAAKKILKHVFKIS